MSIQAMEPSVRRTCRRPFSTFGGLDPSIIPAATPDFTASDLDDWYTGGKSAKVGLLSFPVLCSMQTYPSIAFRAATWARAGSLEMIDTVNEASAVKSRE